jgi:hypothetical protein
MKAYVGFPKPALAEPHRYHTKLLLPNSPGEDAVCTHPRIHALVSALMRSTPYATCSGRTPPCANTVLPTCRHRVGGEILPLLVFTDDFRIQGDNGAVGLGYRFTV